MQNINLPLLIAHRGASAYAPENTLAAMRKAKELGAKWVECDVMLTKDKQLVCFHDETLDRTTNSTGKLHNTFYENLMEIDAGTWFAMEFAGERIPTLALLLQTIASLHMGINIEIKPQAHCMAETVQHTVEIVDTYWPHTLPPPLFSSFDYTAMLELRRLRADAYIGLLLYRWNSQWLELAQRINAVSIHLPKRAITAKRISLIKEHSFPIAVFTINSIQEAQSLFALGVDTIFSDYPDLLNVGKAI